MTQARDKANIPVLNFASKGIDDNADATAITIDSSENVGIKNTTMASFSNLPATDLVVGSGSTHSGITIYSGTSSGSNIAFADGASGDARNQGIIQYHHNGDYMRFFTSASERMRLNSNGLGIGTSSPRAKLDLGSGSGDSSTISTTPSDYQLILEAPQGTGDYGRNIGWSVGTNGVFASINAVDTGSSDKTGLAFITGDNSGVAEAVRISHDGKIGIGTSSPSATLHVDASGGASVQISRTSQGALYLESDGTNGNIRSTSSSGSLAFQTNGNNERMRILSNGKVGIGETAPLGNLHVKSADSGVTSPDAGANELIVEGSTDTGMSFLSTDTATIRFNDANGAGDASYQYRHDDRSTRIESAGSERMRIDSSGNLLVGTTSQVFAGKMNLAYSRTSHDGFGINCDSTSIGIAIKFKNPNGAVGQISTSGSATTYSTSSDYRLKENVNYNFDATTRLKNLKPARFNFIADADTTVDGFIAHEVSSIVPEAITGTKDAVDEDGNPEYQGIDQSKLVPLLVKTIQELEARITALES